MAPPRTTPAPARGESLASHRRAGADVVLCTPNLGDGGSQRVVSTLANAWSRRGLRVTIITLYRDEVLYTLDPDIALWHVEPPINGEPVPGGSLLSRVQLRIQALRRSSPTADWLWQKATGNDPATRLRTLVSIANRTWRLRRLLDQADSPVVIAFVAPTNVMTILASTGRPWRVVISERNDPTRQKLPFPWTALRRRVYNRADVVTANSRAAVEALRAFGGPSKPVFVPNPLDIPARSAETAPAQARQPIFLAVGRLHWQKAYDVLLQAFARLPESLRAWRLVVLGQGELGATLEAQAAQLGVAERVDFCGHVADPLPYYATASVFTLASRHEGTPNALLEAMACGLPAVVSDASEGPLELVRHEATGLVVPVDDADALSQALQRLAHDAPLRARLGEAARVCLAEFALPRALRTWEQAVGLASDSPGVSGEPAAPPVPWPRGLRPGQGRAPR